MADPKTELTQAVSDLMSQLGRMDDRHGFGPVAGGTTAVRRRRKNDWRRPAEREEPDD
jgi:hypothetical protein